MTLLCRFPCCKYGRFPAVIPRFRNGYTVTERRQFSSCAILSSLLERNGTRPILPLCLPILREEQTALGETRLGTDRQVGFVLKSFCNMMTEQRWVFRRLWVLREGPRAKWAAYRFIRRPTSAL